MLKVSRLSSKYKNIQAITDINIHVEKGKIVTLIGSNGSGKTTTLRTIAGVKDIAEGELIFDGASIAKVPAFKRVAKGIAMVPEGRGVFADLTVKENLNLGAFCIKSGKQKKEKMEKQFEIFPVLKERMHQKAGTLSGGEQQMLAIARALLAEPKLLLLDEPSMGLAPIIVEKIFDVIQRINKSGVTILLVEQNAALALEVSDYAYVLENGRIVLQGTAQQLESDPRVQRAYLGLENAE